MHSVCSKTSWITRHDKDKSIQEHCIRALADRKAIASKLPLQPFTDALKSDNPRVQVNAAIALGRIGNPKAADALLTVAKPPVRILAHRCIVG